MGKNPIHYDDIEDFSDFWNLGKISDIPAVPLSTGEQNVIVFVFQGVMKFLKKKTKKFSEVLIKNESALIDDIFEQLLPKQLFAKIYPIVVSEFENVDSLVILLSYPNYASLREGIVRVLSRFVDLPLWTSLHTSSFADRIAGYIRLLRSKYSDEYENLIDEVEKKREAQKTFEFSAKRKIGEAVEYKRNIPEAFYESRIQRQKLMEPKVPKAPKVKDPTKPRQKKSTKFQEFDETETSGRTKGKSTKGVQIKIRQDIPLSLPDNVVIKFTDKKVIMYGKPLEEGMTLATKLYHIGATKLAVSTNILREEMVYFANIDNLNPKLKAKLLNFGGKVSSKKIPGVMGKKIIFNEKSKTMFAELIELGGTKTIKDVKVGATLAHGVLQLPDIDSTIANIIEPYVENKKELLMEVWKRNKAKFLFDLCAEVASFFQKKTMDSAVVNFVIKDLMNCKIIVRESKNADTRRIVTSTFNFPIGELAEDYVCDWIDTLADVIFSRDNYVDYLENINNKNKFADYNAAKAYFNVLAKFLKQSKDWEECVITSFRVFLIRQLRNNYTNFLEDFIQADKKSELISDADINKYTRTLFPDITVEENQIISFVILNLEKLAKKNDKIKFRIIFFEKK